MVLNGRNSEDARTELALVLDNLFKFLSPEQVVIKLFNIYNDFQRYISSEAERVSYSLL